MVSPSLIMSWNVAFFYGVGLKRGASNSYCHMMRPTGVADTV